MQCYKLLQFEKYDIITQKLQYHYRKMLESTQLDASPIYFDELNSIVPELIVQFDNKNLMFDIGRAFVTPPGCSLPIHLDGSETYLKDMAINWPLYNTEESIMNWFSTNDTFEITSDLRYSPHIKVYREENCTLIDSLKLTSPALVKINIPHNVNNFGKYNRVVISFRFKPEPYALWNSL